MAGGPGEAVLDGVVRGAGFSFKTSRPRALAGRVCEWSWSWCGGYGCRSGGCGRRVHVTRAQRPRSGLCVHITRAQRSGLCAVFTPAPFFYDPVVFLVRGHVPGTLPGWEREFDVVLVEVDGRSAEDIGSGDGGIARRGRLLAGFATGLDFDSVCRHESMLLSIRFGSGCTSRRKRTVEDVRVLTPECLAESNEDARPGRVSRGGQRGK